MLRPPYLARVAAGAAVYALEESRRLPRRALTFPITAIGQLLQTSMHAQQFVTSLAMRGDDLFDRFARRPEQPRWATFDDDDDDAPPPVTTGNGYVATLADEARTHRVPHPAASAAETTSAVAPEAEEIIARCNYPELSLAQLRARLRTFSVAELRTLLQYERHNESRAPFVTMLTNRIATVTAQ